MTDATYYAPNHEWVRIDPDGLAMVGLAPQGLAGLEALTAVDLPEPGRNVVKGETCATLHTSTAQRDVTSPLTGTIAEPNAALTTDPAIITAPDGWIFKLRLADASAFTELMTEDDYAAFLKAGT